MSQAVNDINARGINTAFESADVGAVNVGTMGEFFLREPRGPSLPPQVEGKHLSNSHDLEKLPLNSILPRSILYIRVTVEQCSDASGGPEGNPLGFMLLFAVGCVPPQAGVGRVGELNL